MTEENFARRALPIELSSIVTCLVTLTCELTKKLTRDELTQVVADLCVRLRALPDDKRGPNRPFGR